MMMEPRATEETDAAPRVGPPDTPLPDESQSNTPNKSAAHWPKGVALALIRFYQNVISPRTPPTCFFYPTCSHYTYQAIDRFGFWRGAWLGLSRICRCHPFARGGYDPVPHKFSMLPAHQRPEELRKDLDE